MDTSLSPSPQDNTVTIEQVERIRKGMNRPLDDDTEQTLDRWVKETQVSLQRFSFERAVRNLPMLEALALIRAAYNCSLSASVETLAYILRQP